MRDLKKSIINKCKNCGYRLSLAGKLINKIKIYYCKKCGWRGTIYG